MKRRPRWVVDTNVLVSAFLWRGTPARVIELAGERDVQLFTSRTLLDELAATLTKKKLAKYVAATALTPDQMLASYRRIATLVTARQLDAQVSRDVDDDAVLACAQRVRHDARRRAAEVSLDDTARESLRSAPARPDGTIIPTPTDRTRRRQAGEREAPCSSPCADSPCDTPPAPP